MEQNNNISGKKTKITTGKHSLGKKGFTLIEIMVVVVIIGIVALFAGPELIDFGPNLRVKAAARDLHTNLQKMKVEATKRNRDVLITLNPVACPAHPSATVPAPGGTFTIDIDMDNSGTVTAGDVPFAMSDDAAPDPDYDMPKNTALCINASLPAVATKFKFTPQALWLNAPVPPIPPVAQAAVFQIQNDRGRAYQVSVSIAGGISTIKL